MLIILALAEFMLTINSDNNSDVYFNPTFNSVPPVLKKTGTCRDIFIFLVQTSYRSTGSFDNTRGDYG